MVPNPALARRHIDAVYSDAIRRVGGNVAVAEDVTQAVVIARPLPVQEDARRDPPLLYGVGRCL